MTQIKPCPFCGSAGIEIIPIYGCFQVKCHDCFMGGPASKIREGAVEKWKTLSGLRWISVDDRMPDAYEAVMIAVRGNASEPVMMGYFDGDDWRNVFDYYADVTHWMDLPEEPKQKPSRNQADTEHGVA